MDVKSNVQAVGATEMGEQYSLTRILGIWALAYAFPSWRFRSTWMGIVVHSVQNVYFSFLILGIVLGLA